MGKNIIYSKNGEFKKEKMVAKKRALRKVLGSKDLVLKVCGYEKIGKIPKFPVIIPLYKFSRKLND